jgi:hypothetical protein
MTERIRIEHTFECSEKAFWDTFLKEEYNKEMFCQRMKFPRWEITTFEAKEDEVIRVVEVEPYVGELPGAIKKVIGDNVGYREEGRLDRIKNSYKLKVIPARLADKLFIKGEQFTQSLGESRCRRVFEAEVQVKIFGIGGLIEKHIVGDLKRSYDVGADFTKNYMKEHELA